jgi:membrane-associated phospholipid phosphatase
MPHTVRRGHQRHPLLLVALVAAFVLVYWLAVRTHQGQLYDARFFGWVGGLRRLSGPLPELVRQAMPLVLVGATCVPAVLTIAGRRWRRLVAAVLVVAVACVAAQLLKHEVLTRPDLGDHGYVENSYPSGHVAVVAALCVAVVLLWPGGPNRYVVIGAATVAGLTAVADVVSFAHRPSDVVGSLLLVAAVTVAVRWALRLGTAPPVTVRDDTRPAHTVVW